MNPMKASKKPGFGALLAVLLVHSASWAQQGVPPDAGAGKAPTAAPARSPEPPQWSPPPVPAAPAPAPAAPPAPPAQPAPQRRPAQPKAVAPAAPTADGPASPAPAYPYGPPPGYGSPPPPPQLPPSYYYYPPPPPVVRGVWRPFTITLGLAFGALSLPGDSTRDYETSLGYLARVGFGVSRDWVVFLGLDGANVSTPDGDTSVTNYLIGAQYFVLPQLYLRAGMGIASFSEERLTGSEGATGQGFLAAVGYEFLQGENVALAAEGVTSASRFSGGSYFHNAVGLSLNFY
jgi:hypothetical protein